MIRPYYKKAAMTLGKLVETLELSKQLYFMKVLKMYEVINLENTLKLLLRC